MKEILENLKSEVTPLLRDRRKLLSLLILGILILALPIGMDMLTKQRIIKLRATNDPIVFTGPNVRQKSDGNWVTTSSQVQLQITSPLGPPGGGGQ